MRKVDDLGAGRNLSRGAVRDAVNPVTADHNHLIATRRVRLSINQRSCPDHRERMQRECATVLLGQKWHHQCDQEEQHPYARFHLALHTSKTSPANFRSPHPLQSPPASLVKSTYSPPPSKLPA